MNGEDIIYSCQKNEVVIYISTDTSSNQFVKDLALYGQTNVDKGVTFNIVRVKCKEHYEEVINLCRQTPLIVSSFSPLLTKQNSSFEVSCTGDVIVMLKDNVGEDQLYKSVASNEYSVVRKSPFRNGKYIFSSNTNEATAAFQLATLIYQTGLVKYAVPDFYMYNILQTNDEYYDHQWGLNNLGQTGGVAGVDINVSDAWNISTGNSSIKVAVVDCGVDLEHPDLTNVLIDGYDAVDSITMGGNSNAYETHGTMCAGIIGAQHNNNYTAGVSPNCKIIPIRSMLAYGGSSANLAEGIEYAVNAGADVISNSWGTSSPDAFDVAIDDAIQYALQYGRGGKGCVVVFSSGNNNHNQVQYPANTAGVIAVGAVDHCGQRSGRTDIFDNTEIPCSPWGPNSYPGSSYGSMLNVVAPGSNVYSLDLMVNGGYTANFGGTSSACPHVAGVAALMLSVNPYLTHDQIIAIINKTASKVGNYTYTYNNNHPFGRWNEKIGYGMINAGAAVQMAYDLRNVGDLYVKDNLEDTGAEPNTTTSVYTNAPEIRIVKDGQEVTTIKAGETYEVRITVRNCDSRSTPAGKKVRLNWSRVSNSMPWNSAWRSLPQYPWNPWSSVRGGYIGQCELPLIYTGGFYEASVTWTVPTLNDIMAYPFGGFNWSCALLARIEDGYVTEGENFTNYDITSFVANNNNVARKNITILQENHEPLVAALEYVRDIDGSFPIRLQYKSKPNSLGQHLSEVAEIHLQFDENLTQIWEQSGSVPEGCSYKGNGLFIIKDTVVNFDGLAVDTSKTYFFSAYAKFHEALPAEESVMSFDINQFVLAKDDTIFGGNINFTAVYDEDAYMQVIAYEDKSALAGDGIQFTAASAASDAEYVWFNMVGDTIGIGDELNVTASTTQRYYLVGRSELDEAIGYDSVTVTVRLAAITALTPNPANNQTVVGYRLATNVTSATVVITNATGQVLYSAPLDVTQTTHTVNLQAIPTGQYSVRIESQGSPLDSKTLIVY